MSKRIEAIRALLSESKNMTVTKAGLKGVRQAGKALGLDEEEQIDLEIALEFRNSDSRQLWASLTTVKERK